MAKTNTNSPSQSTVNKLHQEISKVDQALMKAHNVQKVIDENPDAFTYISRIENLGAVGIDKLVTQSMAEGGGLAGKSKEYAQNVIKKQAETMSVIGELYSQNVLNFAGAVVKGDELERLNLWVPSPKSSAAENQVKAKTQVDNLTNTIKKYREHLQGVGRQKALITGISEYDMETISSLQDKVDSNLTALEADPGNRKLNKAYEESNKMLESYVDKFNKHYKDKGEKSSPPQSAEEAISRQDSQFKGEVTGDLQRQKARADMKESELTNSQKFTPEQLRALAEVRARRRQGQ
jgi:hypothetical protein